MRNRLIRRIDINVLKKDDQFMLGGSRNLYTYTGKLNGQHTACKWTGKNSGIMTVLPGKSMTVELVTGHGMPGQCVFGSSYQKLLSRKVVVS